MNHVREAIERRQRARAELDRATNDLEEAMRLAHTVDGHTAAELMEWTGLSRRQVFYLLKDTKPA